MPVPLLDRISYTRKYKHTHTYTQTPTTIWNHCDGIAKIKTCFCIQYSPYGASGDISIVSAGSGSAMSSPNNVVRNEKFPIGKSASISLTRCNCRKCACCQLYYQDDWKRHIETVKTDTFLQLKKYEITERIKIISKSNWKRTISLFPCICEMCGSSRIVRCYDVCDFDLFRAAAMQTSII